MEPLRLARTVINRAVAATAGRNADVVLKTDGSGWILDQFCRNIQRHLSGRMSIYVSSVPVAGLRDAIVQFIASECFYDPDWARRFHPSNPAIGTWWHGSPATPDPSVRAAAERVARVSGRLARVHVTCTSSRDIVRTLGVAEEKIALVPMGVDLTVFAPPDAAARAEARRALSISDEALVVGSFQKDGVGWGAGDVPKLIKGPDVFVRVMRGLAERLPVVALIPGPARGYVTRELLAAGVMVRTSGFVPIETFSRYYHACDVYAMCGREEGGPASVLEALATGTPLVAHRTGMASDVVVDGANGFLTSVGDVAGMIGRLERLLTDAPLRARIAGAGVDTARGYAWPLVAAQYEQLYRSVQAR